MAVAVTVTVVIVTAAAPIDDAPLYSSGRVARGGVAAVLFRTTGTSRKNVRIERLRLVPRLLVSYRPLEDS